MHLYIKELHLLSVKSISKFPFISIALRDDGLGEFNLGLWGIIFTIVIVFI